MVGGQDVFCDCFWPASVRPAPDATHGFMLLCDPLPDPRCASLLPARLHANSNHPRYSITPTVTQHRPVPILLLRPIFSSTQRPVSQRPHECQREFRAVCAFGTQHSPFRSAMIGSSFHQPYRLRCRSGIQHSPSGELPVAPADCRIPTPT